MKVALTITVDIDEKAWSEAYGIEPKDVRTDVKEHCNHLLHGTLEGMGLLK